MVDLIAVKRLIAAVNAARWPALLPASTTDSPDAEAAEQELDALFQTNETLAVYGTLAPGKPNHHIVAPYGGTWTDGVVEGDLSTGGWGSALGYPAFKPRDGGSRIDVKVLKSPLLSTAWADVDEFEGSGYQRILVPVYDADDEVSMVANVYACLQSEPQ